MTLAKTNLQSRIGALLGEYRIPSAVVGVLRDDEITDFAIGVRNVETGEPTTTDTVYQCGSLSKVWTALAFMQLVDEGKVDLDEPVRTYLPAFKVADPAVSARVTPRHLLNHTNGIEEAFGDPGEGDDVLERMVENIAEAPQVFPLDYTLGYSAALGSAILGRIMEVVEGGQWDELMKTRLFNVMGLTRTSTWRGQVDEPSAAAAHVIKSPEADPSVLAEGDKYLPRAYGPGGNVNSTPREVLALAHVFLSDGRAPNGAQIVSPGIVGEMMASRVAIPEPYMSGPEWALGLVVSDWQGATVFGHDGSTGGQTAHMRFLPNANLAIAVMMNGSPRLSLFPKLFNEILSDLGEVRVPAYPEPDRKLKLDASKYVGRFVRLENRIDIDADGDRLYLSFVVDPRRAEAFGRDRFRYELLPINASHFLMHPEDPRDDVQPIALYDFKDGVPQLLHVTFRANPRIGG
jgi:CubicO group peptidase (beta-lactamase class C family)